MGPEIFFAFFAFLEIVFGFILRAVWKVFFFSLIYIPYTIFNNYIRVHFWGLSKKQIDIPDSRKGFF